jgi:AcrR family transcriptional regulator
VLGEPTRDRRAERREATRREILDAAWDQVRQHGLAALSLRDLARTVGMQPPSLYGYFDSKNAIYDAMYEEWVRAFVDGRPSDPPEEPVEALKVMAHYFVGFCTADPARYQLLFQRTIPGFEPSAESFEVSKRGLAEAAALLARVGITEPQSLDLYTALVTGLADQQISNDPGGRRWIRIVDDAIEMFYEHTTKTTATRAKGRRAK